MYTYDDYYEEEVINEEALDMAMDMSDRYGVAIEDAYDFTCDAMEGSLKDPHKRVLREVGRYAASRNALDEAKDHDRQFKHRYTTGRTYEDPDDIMDSYEKAESYRYRHGDGTHADIDNRIKHERLNSFRKGLNDPNYRGRSRDAAGSVNRGRTLRNMPYGMDKYSPEYYRGRNNSRALKDKYDL